MAFPPFAVTLVLILLAADAAAQGAPGTYWKFGGRSPVSTENLGESVHFCVGAGGTITGLNACGKFDLKANVDAMFDQIKQLISTLENVPATILLSLPGYIICRAKPGLC